MQKEDQKKKKRYFHNGTELLIIGDAAKFLGVCNYSVLRYELQRKLMPYCKDERGYRFYSIEDLKKMKPNVNKRKKRNK